MSYVLLVTIATTFGAVRTDKAGGPYASYQSCVEDAFGRIESMRPLYPDMLITWECQKDKE